MVLRVPHYWQETSYLCGAASVKMVLAYFGKRISQRRLTQLVGLSSEQMREVGIDNEFLTEMSRLAGFYAMAKNNSNLAEIRKLLSLSLAPIVNFVDPDDNTGHFAVVVGLGKTKIVLNDPHDGKNFKWDIDTFFENWRSGFQSHKRWLLAISPRPAGNFRWLRPTKKL